MLACLVALLVGTILGYVWAEGAGEAGETLAFLASVAALSLCAHAWGPPLSVAAVIAGALGGLCTKLLAEPWWERRLQIELQAWEDAADVTLPATEGVRETLKLVRTLKKLGPVATEVFVTLCRDATPLDADEVAEYAAAAAQLAT